jgi:hypothetical protein
MMACWVASATCLTMTSATAEHCCSGCVTGGCSAGRGGGGALQPALDPELYAYAACAAVAAALTLHGNKAGLKAMLGKLLV